MAQKKKKEEEEHWYYVCTCVIYGIGYTLLDSYEDDKSKII